jgi:hypothetical protein
MGGRQFQRPIKNKKQQAPKPQVNNNTQPPLDPPRKEHKGWDHLCLGATFITEYLAVTYQASWLAWLGGVFLFLAVRSYAKHLLPEIWFRRVILVLGGLIVCAVYALTHQPPKLKAEVENKPAAQPSGSMPNETNIPSKTTTETVKPAAKLDAIPPAKTAAPAKKMTKAEGLKIVNQIVDSYKKTHNGQDPTEAWVNAKLKAKGVRGVATLTHQGSATFTDYGSEFSGGYGAGIEVDSGSKVDMEFNGSKIDNNGGPGIKAGSNVDMKIKMNGSEVENNGTLPEASKPPSPQ